MPRQQSQAISVVNVRFPSELLSIIDSLVEKGLYKSRSEAIRDMLRTRINEP